MGTFHTVIFADLTGSTGVFEALGNQKATLAVTRLTQLMAQACESHHGDVVKTLGDGVLAVFEQVSDAIAAMVALQREHRERIAQWPPRLVMQIKVGTASGNIVRVDGDCYGEAVNLAARLCDMAGPSEIWATAQVTDAAPQASGVRVRALGPVAIRGMAEAREVCQIHWDGAENTDLLTLPAPLGGPEAPEKALSRINLT
jgi:adenylate cyclase